MNALRDLGYIALALGIVVLAFVTLGRAENWKVLPEYHPKPHFWQKHPVRTKALFAVGGLGLGIVAHKLTTHNCDKFYEGKRYDGTPPCPK